MSLAELIKKTPIEVNPVFIKDDGKYARKFDLTKAEARALDSMTLETKIMLQTDQVPKRIICNLVRESKRQGRSVRTVSRLLIGLD